MTKEIQVIVGGIAPNIIHESLQNELGKQDDVKLAIKRFRALETAIVVAVVSTAGIALQALLQAALTLAETRSSQKLVIQGSSGRRIEVPVGIAKEDLQEYVKQAKEIDISLIEIEAPR